MSMYDLPYVLRILCSTCQINRIVIPLKLTVPSPPPPPSTSPPAGAYLRINKHAPAQGQHSRVPYILP